MTVLDMIKSSLRLLKVIAAGETPSSQLSTDCLEVLNLILDEWSAEPAMCLSEENEFTASAGTASYTISDGGTWDLLPPIEIIHGTVNENNIDFPLKCITDVEYNRLALKTVQSRPCLINYLKGETSGTIRLYPTPEASYIVRLLTKKRFTGYTLLTSDIDLPPVYKQLLRYTLAVEFAGEVEIEPSAFVMNQAREKMAKLKKSNHRRPSQLLFNGQFSGQSSGYDYRTGE